MRNHILVGFSKEAESVDELIRSKKPLNNIPGGKAQGRSPSEFCPRRLRRGVKIEAEHTPSKAKALEISMDHESEFPGYYDERTGLPAFERKLEKRAFILRPAMKMAYRGVNQLVRGKMGPQFSHPGLRNASITAGNIDQGMKQMAGAIPQAFKLSYQAAKPSVQKAISSARDKIHSVATGAMNKMRQPGPMGMSDMARGAFPMIGR